MGCPDALLPKRADFSKAQVVRQDEDDVGQFAETQPQISGIRTYCDKDGKRG
ncbi:MAG: hypothetical protein AMXMBFR81_20050 [Chthonomonas sp.]